MDTKKNEVCTAARYRGEFSSKVIKVLPNCKEGEIVFNTDTKKGMIYKNGKWEDMHPDNAQLSMSLYDLNQSIIQQLDDITDFIDKINLINKFGIDSNNQYYMLYGKDISYFTIFNKQTQAIEDFGSCVIDCLKSFKSVKAIDLTSNEDAIEIWIITNKNQCTCLYLFPYDAGIVECR